MTEIKYMCGAFGTVATVTNVQGLCNASCCLTIDRGLPPLKLHFFFFGRETPITCLLFSFLSKTLMPDILQQVIL